MSKRFPTKAKMAAANIHNSHEIAILSPEPKVWIWHRPQSTGRAYQGAAFQVIRIGYKTDPNGHWRDYGHKTFDVPWKGEKDAALEAATKWANWRYGKRVWIRDPFGSYQDERLIPIIQETVRKHEQAFLPDIRA